MDLKKFSIHFVRRCFFNRSFIIVLLSVAFSFVVNYVATLAVISQIPSHYGGSFFFGSAGQPTDDISDISLTLADLRQLKKELESESRIKESYVHELNDKIASLRTEAVKLDDDIYAQKSAVSALQENARRLTEKIRYIDANYTPKVLLPIQLSLTKGIPGAVVHMSDNNSCDLVTCFDYSRCPLFSPLCVLMLGRLAVLSDIGLFSATQTVQEACVFVSDVFDAPMTSSWLNHVLLLKNDGNRRHIQPQVMVAAVAFSDAQYRQGFDFIIPFVSGCGKSVHTVLPVKRTAIFSVVLWQETRDVLEKKSLDILLATKPVGGDVINKIRISIATLPDDCLEVNGLNDSTFTIVHHRPNVLFGALLSEILRSGSIPVILVSNAQVLLPLSDVVEWTKIAVVLPSYRASELYYLLKTISVQDVTNYRLEASKAYRQFFHSLDTVVAGVLACITKRLKLPAPPFPEYEAKSAYSPTHYAPTEPMEPVPFAEDGNEVMLDEYLGPAELPRPSDKYTRNFTVFRSFFVPLFNVPNNPLDQQPFPHDVIFKADASLDFRPVGEGFGGSGRQLGLALGGNRPSEQFTIVVLTRGGDRISILIDIVSRFKNLPYLNKVIIVWNDPIKSPPSTLKWPQLVVPVFVAQMSTNSLNNRFLPMSEIETDAVLSLDDDIFLRPDEIVFAFRVWRENRDQIVGFPSRGHGWNATSHRWLYISDYSCEYSLILTGAAFIHKYYLYLYSYTMPAAIRKTVDELMNCEDIAMNFLVSHMTRKAPLKVTVRWTFHCPTCQTTLSKEQAHYNERAQCLARFAGVYGYMPLLFSQSRADSVLFKTRIPSSHQKCFKFV